MVLTIAPTQRTSYDLDELDKLVHEHYLTKRTHPDQDGVTRCAIYNYTPKAQFGGHWNELTMACRGLILNEDGSVHSRPFAKFFNLGESHEGVPEPNLNQPFVAYEKVDGSLCISYQGKDGLPRLATRGSFNSDQSVQANRIMAARGFGYYTWYNPRYTYLFELVTPTNQIVIDYGDTDELVLLAVIDTANGVEVDRPFWPTLFRWARIFGPHNSIQELAEEVNDPSVTTLEGYVLRFQDGTRIKLKYASYRILHRLMTSSSWRTIWDGLRTGYDPRTASGYELSSETFKAFVTKAVETLTANHDRLAAEARRICDTPTATNPSLTRKEKAAYFKLEADLVGMSTGPLFAILDGKDYDEVIWKSIKPDPATSPGVTRAFLRDDE